VSEGRKPAEQEAEHCHVARALLHLKVPAQAGKGTGSHLVRVMLNNVRGTEGTCM